MMSHTEWVLLCMVSWLVFTLAEATDAQSCTYAKKVYSHGSSVKMDEPCLTCSCNTGQLVCHLRMCPTLPDITRKGCRIEKIPEKCCPRITCDSTNTTSSGFGKFIHTNQVGRKDDSFYAPEISKTSSSIDTRTNKGGCKVDESFFADGSALPSTFHCTNCYCLKGNVRCIRPKCHLNITGCQPQYNHQHACCPTHYDCSLLGTTISDGYVTKPTITRKVCFWKSQRYQDGTRIATHDPCRSCFCVRGTVKCTTQECAPPVEGCTPIRQKGFCCPLEYECDSDYNSTHSELSDPVEDTTVMSSKIRGNDRVIDFPYDQLSENYHLVKRTPPGHEAPMESRSHQIKDDQIHLMRLTSKFPSEFKDDINNRQEKSHSGSKKPTRSATSMLYFPPRGNNRRILFSKRQRSSTTPETSKDDDLSSDYTVYDLTKEVIKSTVTPKVKTSYKPRRKTTITGETAVPVTSAASARRRKKTTVSSKDVTEELSTNAATRSFKSTTKRAVPEATSPLTIKTEKFSEVYSKISTNSDVTKYSSDGSPEPHYEGYHVLDAGESYNDGYDDFHEESAFGIEWPALAANVYDYFKEESHANTEVEQVEEKSAVTEKENKFAANRGVNLVIRNISTITTSDTAATTTAAASSTTNKKMMEEKVKSTTEKIAMQSIETESSSKEILKTTTAIPTTSSPMTSTSTVTTTTTTTTTTESSTKSETEPTIKTFVKVNETIESNATDISTTNETLGFDIETELPTTLSDDASESKTIFLKRVGLNFQVSQQKPQAGINWTSRLVPEGHPAADPAARFSKTGTATIQKLPSHEGRGITRLLIGQEEDDVQTSRSEDSSIIDGIDFPISEDSPAFQVIPFLPEDAVLKEQQQQQQQQQQSNMVAAMNKTWQGMSTESKENKVTFLDTLYQEITTASNGINKTLKNDPLGIISRSHLETSPRSDSKGTDSYLSRWIPIRHEEPQLYNNNMSSTSRWSSSKSSVDSEETDESSSSSLLGLLSLFGFSGLGGAKKSNTNNQSQISVISPTTMPQLLVTPESNGWLPLKSGSEEIKPADISGFTNDQFVNQPLSTAAMQMRLPNATGNMFLIGQPKEEIHPITLDHIDDQWVRQELITNKPTTTTEPILKLILSHIHNSSQVEEKSTVTIPNVKTTESITKEATTLLLRHGTKSTTENSIMSTMSALDNANLSLFEEEEEKLEDNRKLFDDVTNISHSHSISNDGSVNFTTRNSFTEETTTVSIWDLLNLFGPKETTEKSDPLTTQIPMVDLNNYSYFPLSDSYNYEPLQESNLNLNSNSNSETNFETNQSVLLNDNLNEAKPTNQGVMPENDASGIYNPFILQVKGCDIYGKYYNMGEVVKELSSSCKQCVCAGFGVDCTKIC